MDAAIERALGETAIGRSNDVLAADQLREADDALRHQLGMLDDVGGVTDDTGSGCAPPAA